MSKILKKKIKNTLPVIVLFCLLNALVLGFSFNLNLNFVKPILQKGFVNLASNVEASTATTSVQVKNSPPDFKNGVGATVYPAESPASTSTSPVNVGGSIGFTATGNDGEGDNYFLIICAGNKATSSGTWPYAPTCVASTQFCVSAKASSTVAAACTYNNVADPGYLTQTQAWYAFLCDDHLGSPQCTTNSGGGNPPYNTVNQGNGSTNSASPFYVNHAPHLNYLYTSIDNQNPGQNVTITASTTDYDHAGSNYNKQNFYICATNSWTVGGGCGGATLCHSTSSVPSTASSSVSCAYTIPIPSNHVAFPYYGFIKDQYQMPATTTRGQGSTNNYHVNNVAPVLSNVTLNQGNNVTLNISGAPQKLVKASSTSVTDNNGCPDLSSATSTIYLNSVAGGFACAANNSNCYKIGTSNCAISNCSGASSISATVTCSTTLAFFTMPTDASAPASTTNSWFAKIKVADSPGLSGSSTYNTLNGVEVISSAALNVTEAAIPYGQVQAGTNTGSFNASTTIVNYGNTPIDTALIGTDMLKNKVGPEKIRALNQQYNINPFTFTAGNMSSTTPSTAAVGIARPLDFTPVTHKIYWGINVPFGVPSNTFYGVNTFTVVLNKYDTWNYP
jgi:hypothetical protein